MSSNLISGGVSTSFLLSPVKVWYQWTVHAFNGVSSLFLFKHTSANTMKCDKQPPNPGDFLSMRVSFFHPDTTKSSWYSLCLRPAGGSIVLELGSNQAFTSMSYGGKFMTEWPNGQTYPDDYVRRFPSIMILAFLICCWYIEQCVLHYCSKLYVQSAIHQSYTGTIPHQ